LFGEDVLLLLDMDRANSANCILVSDAALGLISSGPGRQFTPVCKVVCDGGREVQMHAVQMHALTGQVGGDPAGVRTGEASDFGGWAQLGGDDKQGVVTTAACADRASSTCSITITSTAPHCLSMMLQVGSSPSAPQSTQQLPAPLLPAAAGQRAVTPAQRLISDGVVLPAMSFHCQQQRLEQPVQQPPQRTQEPQQQQQQLNAAIAAAQLAAKSTQWQPQRSSNATSLHQANAPPQAAASTSSAAAAEDGTASRTMQPNLSFADPVLESAYMEFQRQPLACMDLLFILLTLGVTLFSFWDPSSSGAGSGYPLSRGQLLLASSGQWLLLLVAAVWLLVSPRSYSRWREALWVAHRLLAAVHVAVLGLLSSLLQQGMMRGAAGGPAGAAAAAAAATVLKGVLGLHRGKGLALLAEQLGLKVGVIVLATVSAGGVLFRAH
jgi:hypothetical protein